MSLWTDPIIIPPLQIIIFIFGFLVNKIIDKKSGKNLTDLERINYVGDRLVDTSMMHGKKVKGTIKAIMSDDEEKPIETIPGVNSNKPTMDEIDQIILTNGLALSELQLELDHVKHKLTEAGIDINNGETKDNPILD